MKKICLVAHLNDLSGANKSLIDLAVGLKKHYDVRVIVPRKGLLYDELYRKGINTVVIPSATWVFKQDEKFVKKIVKVFLNTLAELRYLLFLCKGKIDLVHFNSSVYGTGAVAARMLRIPYTWHIRELAEENFNLIFYKRKKCFKLINNANAVITISEFMKRKIEKDINFDKISVVYNGVVPSKSVLLNDNAPISLTIIGAIASDKGQLDAVRAVKYLKQEKNISIKLYIVGAVTDQEYYEKLKSEITPEIEGNIIFVGYLKDVSEYRKSKYVALMCSKGEAFGRVTIEAMNSGQIIIAANAGASPEIIDDGKNGFLYEYNNPKDLSNKIENVLSLKDKSILIQEARKTVLEQFDIKYTVEGVKEIFDKILEG